MIYSNFIYLNVAFEYYWLYHNSCINYVMLHTCLLLYSGIFQRNRK